jgi:glyceraldehyde 3-phosphate dehydrogenase
MAKVAINGFGRIGRAAFKILRETPELDLVAINDIAPVENLAYLLNYDTVYGKYEDRVEVENGNLVVGGEEYEFLSVKDPTQLPWGEMEVDIVFECTGIFRTGEDLKKHLDAGAKFAVLSAPPKSEDVPTVVHGVNVPSGETRVVSCASCTTNSITPVVEVMDRKFGVQKAMLTTIHAYTSSQAIVDAPSKKIRRGRAGAANFVPTSTGAAIATTKALPELEGKFDGVAVRGPIPVGSVSDLTFVLEQDTTVEEVNQVFREEAESDKYKGILGATDDPIVSSDIVGDPHASLVDLGMTTVVDGNLVKIMAWYDNEWGFTNQMIREGLRIAETL